MRVMSCAPLGQVTKEQKLLCPFKETRATTYECDVIKVMEEDTKALEAEPVALNIPGHSGPF